MDDFIRRIPLVGAGFLLAVLWFDLMFDTLVSGEPAGVLSEEVLSSIAAYYQRAVVDSHPMGSFVGGAMFLTLLAMGRQIYANLIPRKLAIASFGFAVVPISLAMLRVVPNAARLGSRVDSHEVQSELARSIYYDHIGCLLAILVVTAIQLMAVRTAETKAGGEV
jgi:hypothetical protein